MNYYKTTLLPRSIKTRPRIILKARKQVQEFFDQYTPSEALEMLLSACRAAESNQVWDYHNPSEVLHFINAFKNLLVVVFPLTERELRRLGTVSEESEPGGYCQTLTKHLSPDEAADPSFTLFKYTRVNRLTDLKSKLDLIQEFALSKNSIVGSGNNLPILTITELFAKFIESSALLTY
jgi:hypothetical protein